MTITDIDDNEFTKPTSNSAEIKSGVKKSMPAFEVEMEHEQPNNVIYYTSTDGASLTKYKTATYLSNYSNIMIGVANIGKKQVKLGVI